MFCFFFWLHHTVHGILVPSQDQALHPLQWKCRILTTGIPKLMIYTFKVAQGENETLLGNCVFTICVGPPIALFLLSCVSSFSLPSLSLCLSLSVTRVPTTCHQVDPGSRPPLCCWCQAAPWKWILPCQILPPNLHTLSSCLLTGSAAAASFLLASELALAPAPGEAQGKP